MKKKLSTVLLALAAFMPMTAQNLVKGDYGYKMSILCSFLLFLSLFAPLTHRFLVC